MTVTGSTAENGDLTIGLSGRINSSNAAEAELGIRRCLQNAHTAVVLDTEQLDYISSAGLRVVLRLRQEEPSLRIINAGNEVYDVLEMTGFTELLPVAKAYRRVSVKNCEIMGQGANGVVYRLDPETMIKVYRNPDALPEINRERELARKAFVLGIPTAIPYDVVKTEAGFGSVYELLNADSFVKLADSGPEGLEQAIALSVGLLKKIHGTAVKPEDMPDEKQVVLGWAEFLTPYLPESCAERLLKLIRKVPDCCSMLHGDFHFKNIMLQNGEALLIDMDTLCHGHPVFELASMFNAYVGYGTMDPTATEKFIGMPYEVCGEVWKKSLQFYLAGEPAERIAAAEQKAQLIGFVRMMRRELRRHVFEGEKSRAFTDFCREKIMELLDSVDTLEF